MSDFKVQSPVANAQKDTIRNEVVLSSSFIKYDVLVGTPSGLKDTSTEDLQKLAAALNAPGVSIKSTAGARTDGANAITSTKTNTLAPVKDVAILLAEATQLFGAENDPARKDALKMFSLGLAKNLSEHVKAMK